MARVMEFQTLYNAACFRWRKGFVEGGRGMRVQIILDQANVLGLWVDLIDEEAARLWRSRGLVRCAFTSTCRQPASGSTITNKLRVPRRSYS